MQSTSAPQFVPAHGPAVGPEPHERCAQAFNLHDMTAAPVLYTIRVQAVLLDNLYEPSSYAAMAAWHLRRL